MLQSSGTPSSLAKRMISAACRATPLVASPNTNWPAAPTRRKSTRPARAAPTAIASPQDPLPHQIADRQRGGETG